MSDIEYEEIEPEPTRVIPARRRRFHPALVATAAAVAVLVVGGVGYAFGAAKNTAGPARAAASRGGLGAGRGLKGGPGRFGSVGSGAGGQVSKVEGNTLTITDPQGNSVTVDLSGGTTVRKTVDGSVQDIKPGETVVVQGQRNADGSVTATQVTIVPAGSGFGFGRRFGGGGGFAPGGQPPGV